MTNAGYADLVRENLPELPYGNVLAEPTVRDTAGAIGLAASVLTKYDLNATMAVVTADQIIEPDEVLQGALTSAMRFVNANPEALITFGIKPTFPSTQFGYVQFAPAEEGAAGDGRFGRWSAFGKSRMRRRAADYAASGSSGIRGCSSGRARDSA